MSVEVDLVVARGPGSLAVRTRLAEPATGVFGPSGAGKSTLLHVIAGLIRPTRGIVRVDGELLDDVDAGVHVPPYRRRISLVFQHGNLFPHLSVESNLRYGERRGPLRERRVDFEALVGLLDLGALLQRTPRSLSGGERQRVALGRALMASPRLLLLDEPLASLDGALKRQILPYLQRVISEFAIPLIHVSHDLGEILHLTRDLALLERGEIVARGDLLDIASNQSQLSQLAGLPLMNVLTATVERHESNWGLSIMALADGTILHVPVHDTPVGARCQLMIRSEDIMLSRARVDGISVQNQCLGRVVRVTHADDRVVVVVDIGESVLVELSARAWETLALATEVPVWCLFRAHAVVAT